MIEKRKEEAELAMQEAEKEAEMRRVQLARDAEVAEEKRRREEMLRREKVRWCVCGGGREGRGGGLGILEAGR